MTSPNLSQDNSASLAGLGLAASWSLGVAVAVYTVIALWQTHRGYRIGGVYIVALSKWCSLFAIGVVTATAVSRLLLVGASGGGVCRVTFGICWRGGIVMCISSTGEQMLERRRGDRHRIYCVYELCIYFEVCTYMRVLGVLVCLYFFRPVSLCLV